MSESISIIAWVGFTFAAAGLVKGFAGMGFPAIAMGALSLVMAPAAAAALVIVPSFVTNFWQMLAGPAFAELARRLAGMMVAVVGGTALGIGVLTGQSATLAGTALGVALALYGALSLAVPRFTVSAAAEPWLSPVMGLLTGLLTGATGVFAIPAVPYLNSLGLAKEQLLQALGICFTVATVSLACALSLHGKFPSAAVWSSALAVVPALAGMVIGQRVRRRLEPEAFRRWFCIGLIALGLYMIARAVG